MLLPTPYFHTVFTTDHLINDLARVNQREIYNLLFRTAAKMLKRYGKKYLGGEIGFTAVLHTWGQDLREHIHLHVIVTGGALQQTAEGERWQASKKGFLFPVVALSAEFRDEFCKGLLKLYRKGKLKRKGKAKGLDVEAMVAEMQAKKWEVFIRKAFDNPEQVYEYLARYVYRIAISNHRIIDISDGMVSFTYYDNKNGGVNKVMRLPALQFIGRFLLHVLPPRFFRVRHYGLHHSSKRKDMERCRELLGLPPELPEIPELVLDEWVKSITGKDLWLCPFCEKGRMFVRSEFDPVPPWKTKMLAFLGVPSLGQVVG